MNKFLLAIRLLTRIPAGKRYYDDPRDYTGSVLWYFFAAVIVGAVMAGVFFAAGFTGIPYLPALLSVIAACIITGSLHVDGFADTCDAFFTQRSMEERLVIMRDSRLGTYGVVGIIFLIAAKVLLINAISTDAVLLIIAVPVCGKIPLILCASVSEYPRNDGMAKYIVGKLSTGVSFFSLLICSAIVVFYAGALPGALAVGAALAAGLIIPLVSKNRIGGVTGDVLGFSNEVGELLFLLIMGVLY